MIQHKPAIGHKIKQTYEYQGETKTRLGEVIGFGRWDERKGGEFDQTGKGEGAVVVICKYVTPERDTTFAFGIPNQSVEVIR